MEIVEKVKIKNIEEIRKEYIFGKIYMMASPNKTHQLIVGNLYFEIRKKEKCIPIIAPYELQLECNGINKVQPDVMIFCEADLACAIFEVLSPSTTLKDKVIKKRLYECAKIKEYFLVEPEYKIIDKFELINGKYEFIGSFSIKDKLKINYIKEKIDLANIFE